MKYKKKHLLSISKKVNGGKRLTPSELDVITSFEKVDEPNPFVSFSKKAAVPVAITLGFLIAVFPEYAARLATTLSWTVLSEQVHNGLNYIWSIIGEPVEQQNILYHFPNIVLYSFGVLGVKKLFDAIDRKTWIDRVNGAKQKILDDLASGQLRLDLKKGHSILFVGNGDYVGSQFLINNESAVAVSTQKPTDTKLWNQYDPNGGFEGLSTLFGRVCSKDTGEYIFFPVKDDQIFLPGPKDYDLSPHKLDILCKDIRTLEKKNKWKAKRIIVVGDKFHMSQVQSEDRKKVVSKSGEIISLQSIAIKHQNVTIVDPTDIVLKRIISIAKGRKIVFRATKEGISEYKNRFYQRLDLLGAKETKKGTLTIGYDLFEDQTEQQTLSRTIDDYYPVVLSKSVRDALIRNGYKKEEFIYVPDLVLAHLTKMASEQ